MKEEKFDIVSIDSERFVYSFESIVAFRTAFKLKFKYIVAFHATNLSNEELICIQKKGLKIASKELLESKAIHRFIVNESESKSKEIEKDIKEWFSNERLYDNKFYTKNEINFGLVKDDLFENYHYLLFGSESLLQVADYLKKKHHKSFRQILVNSGFHYIIEVLIPVAKIDDEWIDSIYDFFKGEYSFPISLVYYTDLSHGFIVKIEKVTRPNDKQNLILI
ncbi:MULTISPECIES: hypothetical protein [unclassified Flavobacterium]|uniref:hypothetical protein n=1 Tax=unclassified Flavobacterium TaxID=196869 RepID=UPI00156E9D80|nr:MULTISPECIES: hypothetical protein [unclassified Flavobacterium]MBE0392637.1 hypothetical protein [Flavobacterium sp. PL002]NRT13387.1 hypothetical protein [Flavobacterium sp. 14A]